MTRVGMHLDEVRVGACLVETPCEGGEVNKGNEVGDAVAGLVVQEQHAARAVPEPQVAAISVQYVGVEAQGGMRLFYR